MGDLRRVVALLLSFVPLAPSALGAQCPSPTIGARRLPARFDAGRIVLTPVNSHGDTTDFVLDSGGGFNAVAADHAAALGVATQTRGTAPDTMTVAPIAAFGDTTELPIPAAGVPGHGLLAVTTGLAAFGRMYHERITGFLGSGWWADRIWRIDYLHHALWLLPDDAIRRAPLPSNGHRVALHFRVDSAGHRVTNFARFTAVVAGDTLNLLFDTGATTQLTDSALAIVQDGRPAGRAGNFISSDVFDRWHRRHPGWPVILRGAHGRWAMIRVPVVHVAGYAVGPVWWEERDSTAMHRLMDPLMDAPIQGSMGGAVFRHFAITLDYPDAIACFTR